MLRHVILVGGLALAAGSVVYGQQSTTPPVPEDALAPRELIAWTTLQTPRPAQEQLPAIQPKLDDPSQGSPQRAEQGIDSQPQPEHADSHAVPQPPARTRTR